MESIATESPSVRRAIFRSMAILAGVGGLIVVATLLQGAQGLSASLALGAAILIFGALGLGFMGLVVKNQRLLVGSSGIGYQDQFGRRHLWTSSEIGAVIDASVTVSPQARPRRYVFFLGIDGRRLMMLNDVAWSPNTIDRLVTAANKPEQVRDGPLSPAALRREFSGTYGWLAAHPYVFVGATVAPGLLIALGLSIGPYPGR